MQEHIEHLRRLIRLELDRCRGDLWPNVCRLKQSEDGYRRIEDQVINLAKTEGMPVGSAIALLEQDLAHKGE